MRKGQAILAVALALSLLPAGASRAMTSPALLEPAALAGDWTLKGPGAETCRLVLKAQPAPGGQDLALDLGDCSRLAAPIGQAASWRTSNDGFWLTTRDRSTMLFFSNEGDGLFAARTRDGRRYELRRDG